MFQFPPFATCTYGFSTRRFGNPGISTRLTVSPGLSQSSTPFIAFWRQDIPHMPLVAWPHCSLPHAPPTPKGTPVRETENFASYQARTPKNVSGQVTIQFSKGSQSSLETTPTRPVTGYDWGVVSMQLLSPPNCQRTTDTTPTVTGRCQPRCSAPEGRSHRDDSNRKGRTATANGSPQVSALH